MELRDFRITIYYNRDMNKSTSCYQSTKIIELGSAAFRQWGASHSHCRHTHGYQLKAKFIFGCSELDNKNWCVDYGGLKDLKAVLQDMFDHRLLVAENDPCLDLFKELEKRDACVLRICPNGVGIERAAEYCFNIASDMIAEQYGDRCWVEQVEVFEHDKNSSIYTRSDSTQGAVLEEEEDETTDSYSKQYDIRDYVPEDYQTTPAYPNGFKPVYLD